MASPDHIDTIIGAHVELTGSLRNTGSIHVHGTVTGDIHSEETVIIGPSAIVTGPVHAKIVDVSGKVHGAIHATQHIELQSTSRIEGDLVTSTLSIKTGATFIGTSTMHRGDAQPDNKKNKPRLEID
jgi:cytoskeletal protein CcmA (bactofilin family)